MKLRNFAKSQAKKKFVGTKCDDPESIVSDAADATSDVWEPAYEAMFRHYVSLRASDYGTTRNPVGMDENDTAFVDASKVLGYVRAREILEENGGFG